jgi:hypothetical protein
MSDPSGFLPVAISFGRADREVVVVVHRRVRGVWGKRVERPFVVPHLVRVARDVRVDLRLGGAADEGIVAGEEHRMPVAGHRERVLVVVAAHAPDRLLLAGVDVEGDHDADLVRPFVALDRLLVGPAEAVAGDLIEHPVDALLVREQQRPGLEPVRGREEVRAEAVVAGPGIDGELCREDLAAPADDELAQLRVVEVVERVGGRRRRGVVWERHGRGLVVDPHPRRVPAVRRERDPIGDRLEAIIADGVADGDERLDLGSGRRVGAGQDHWGLVGLEAALGRPNRGERHGRTEQERGSERERARSCRVSGQGTHQVLLRDGHELDGWARAVRVPGLPSAANDTAASPETQTAGRDARRQGAGPASSLSLRRIPMRRARCTR